MAAGQIRDDVDGLAAAFAGRALGAVPDDLRDLDRGELPTPSSLTVSTCTTRVSRWASVRSSNFALAFLSTYT
ncbi:hypothetical protein GCM10022232_63830 [Streptomyces plumbiresistens]|uniref:Uncharacterized protein n=1 Tax=Streptomyces plumbiresistens TaxID=511811 RepID=A0ABP7SKU9_9ACTN